MPITGVSIVFGVCWVSAVFVCLILVGLACYQNRLLYYPAMPGVPQDPDDNPDGLKNPGEIGVPYESLFMKTEDEVTIHGWLLLQKPNSKARPTIIFFHGNAGNVGFRLPNALELYNRTRCNIFMIDYRGYGKSEGSPTEKGLTLDANASLDALRSREDIDPHSIIIFGRSLGGAVALSLADSREDHLKALILENTFLNISEMVDALFPYLSLVKLLILRIKWPSNQYIARTTLPILFIVGEQDQLVPPAHMHQLHRLAKRSQGKRMFTVSTGGHNDSWAKGGVEYYEQIAKFIDSNMPSIQLGLQVPFHNHLEQLESVNGTNSSSSGSFEEGEPKTKNRNGKFAKISPSSTDDHSSFNGVPCEYSNTNSRPALNKSRSSDGRISAAESASPRTPTQPDQLLSPRTLERKAHTPVQRRSSQVVNKTDASSGCGSSSQSNGAERERGATHQRVLSGSGLGPGPGADRFSAGQHDEEVIQQGSSPIPNMLDMLHGKSKTKSKTADYGSQGSSVIKKFA